METANLITVMKNYKITSTETYVSIKLGIDAHAKWYYVARKLEFAFSFVTQNVLKGRTALGMAISPTLTKPSRT